MSKKQEAVKCVLVHAGLAATGCGVFKAVVPVPLIEVGVLTMATKKMCKKLANIYGYDGIAGVTTLIGVAVGAGFGGSLATRIGDFIPGINVAANVASTTILHLTTGAIMIAAFELMKDGYIDPVSLTKSNSVSLVNELAVCATAMVGGVLRGGSLDDVVTSIKNKYLQA